MEGVGIEMEPWDTMPRARDEPEELKAWQKEVENLREEEQEQGLGKAGLDANVG